MKLMFLSSVYLFSIQFFSGDCLGIISFVLLGGVEIIELIVFMCGIYWYNIISIMKSLLILISIGYNTNDLILTNKGVFGKCGLISTTQMQSPLNKIDSVSYSSGLFGKIIGYGTVRISTTSSAFKFRFIRDGQTLYNDIFNQLEISEVESRNLDAMDEKLS